MNKSVTGSRVFLSFDFKSMTPSCDGVVCSVKIRRLGFRQWDSRADWWQMRQASGGRWWLRAVYKQTYNTYHSNLKLLMMFEAEKKQETGTTMTMCTQIMVLDVLQQLLINALRCSLSGGIFPVKSSVLMTNEEEKLLLITLSQVLNKIKVWTAEFDSGSGSDSDNGDHVMDDLKCHSSASCCIPKITNELVFLLCVESQYGQHLAANVLVSVSEFVAASGSYWEEFMQSLCFYFERMIYKVISPSSDPPIRAKHLELLDLQRVLDNARWQSVGAIVLVLRNILKQLKQEDDAKILEIYFQVLGSCLEVIPWDACNIILADDINAPRSSWFEFCGNLLQFCSLADCEEESPAVREVFNVFPNILIWCFGTPAENHNYSCQSQYTRHKILVLMIRLSSLINLDCATVVSWLHLIEKYFHDLLSESVSEPEADQDDCLRDSPFSGTSHRHLQRRVIFLYVKCAFSLTGLKEHCKKQCSCGNMKSCSKRGFTALYEWLKKHLPANIHHNRELYDECCKRITEDWMSEVVEKDILFLLSDIFDPMRLFHLFLSELHYDHQVLLDYLISKDIGASCAEYLLRLC